MFFIIFDVS